MPVACRQRAGTSLRMSAYTTALSASEVLKTCVNMPEFLMPAQRRRPVGEPGRVRARGAVSASREGPGDLCCSLSL